MGKVRTRKRGKTFSYIFEAEKKANGKRRVIEKGGFPTKAAAYEAGTAAYTDWKHGNIGITSERITVKDFLDSWLKNVCAVNVRPTTLKTYRRSFHANVIPFLGQMILQDLTPAILDRWVHQLVKKGLAHRTITSIIVIFSGALKYAVYPAQLIQTNPISYIKVPNNTPDKVIHRVVVSNEQLMTLVSDYQDDKDATVIIILLLYHTGMRIGEVLGLTWEDIDIAEKRIVVSHQLPILGNSSERYLSPTKTPTSDRIILIDDQLIAALCKWKKQQDTLAHEGLYAQNYISPNKQIITCSPSQHPADYQEIHLVCTQKNGFPYRYHSISKKLRKHGLNAHSFRHTHATLLYENGATPKGVAARLGHANTNLTENLYTHITEKMQEDTLEKFADILQTNSKCRQNADK